MIPSTGRLTTLDIVAFEERDKPLLEELLRAKLAPGVHHRERLCEARRTCVASHDQCCAICLNIHRILLYLVACQKLEPVILSTQCKYS